jgi:hypothetical protein
LEEEAIRWTPALPVRETGEMGRASHGGHGGDWRKKRFSGHRGFRCERQANGESIALGEGLFLQA